jgi:hypothetical protein
VKKGLGRRDGLEPNSRGRRLTRTICNLSQWLRVVTQN